MEFWFQVRFRTSRPIDKDADRMETEIKSSVSKRPLRFSRALYGTARDENWLSIESCGIKSCGYSNFQDVALAGEQTKGLLLLAASPRDLGIEFTARGAIPDVAVYTIGTKVDMVDPGAPMPVPLKAARLTEFVSAAMRNHSVLKPNQQVAAALLNDSFFNMPPEARFLLRVAAVEALCPRSEQTEEFRASVHRILASLPDFAHHDPDSQIRRELKRLAKRQTTRRAYMSKIRQRLGNEEAKRFDELYTLRSSFLHEGKGRGTLGQAAQEVFELCWNLLTADI
jgi:hypothetical protein